MGLIGLAVLIFIVVAVLGLSKLSAQSQKMVALKLQSQTLDYQLASLAGAKKQVQQYSYIKEVAAEVIPEDKDQAQAVLEINQIAQQAGIAIGSISFPASTLGTAAVGTATTSTNLISQAQPVTGIKGLYSVQLTITPETGSQVPTDQQVTYDKMIDFLNRIEDNQRTAQITQVNIEPQGTSGGNGASSITFTLTLNIFIKPQ
jgi:hypothetical protein